MARRSVLLRLAAHPRATAQAIARHAQTKKTGRGVGTTEETTVAMTAAMTAATTVGKSDRAAHPADLHGPLALRLDEMHPEAVLIDGTIATGEIPVGDSDAIQSPR